MLLLDTVDEDFDYFLRPRIHGVKFRTRQLLSPVFWRVLELSFTASQNINIINDLYAAKQSIDQ